MIERIVDQVAEGAGQGVQIAVDPAIRYIDIEPRTHLSQAWLQAGKGGIQGIIDADRAGVEVAAATEGEHVAYQGLGMPQPVEQFLAELPDAARR